MIYTYQSLNYNIYTIPLSNDLSYSFNVTINEIECLFTLDYNSRVNQRFLNIKSVDGTVFLDNTFISLTSPIVLNNNFDLLDNRETNIYFRKIDTTIPLDIHNWSDNVEIFITTLPPSELEKYMGNNFFKRFSDFDSYFESLKVS